MRDSNGDWFLRSTVVRDKFRFRYAACQALLGMCIHTGEVRVHMSTTGNDRVSMSCMI